MTGLTWYLLEMFEIYRTVPRDQQDTGIPVSVL